MSSAPAVPSAAAPEATPAVQPGTWTVACLCAAWCTTCDAYRPLFIELAAQWQRLRPGTRFAWIDIEDDADALGDGALDIDNFPTVTLLDGEQVRFHGTVLPHATTLDRMLHALSADRLAPGQAAEVDATMARAVTTLAPSRPASP
jgi:thiol-disulfide isomerase/thioredoxin